MMLKNPTDSLQDKSNRHTIRHQRETRTPCLKIRPRR